MSNDISPSTRIRRPLCFSYLGRPATMYVVALSKRRRSPMAVPMGLPMSLVKKAGSSGRLVA
jgi:hypothetical protein